jgi:hypothetical protein
LGGFTQALRALTGRSLGGMAAHQPPRYPKFVALKMPAELLQRVRRAAQDDDRTLSSYLRRVIAAAVQDAPTADVQRQD